MLSYCQLTYSINKLYPHIKSYIKHFDMINYNHDYNDSLDIHLLNMVTHSSRFCSGAVCPPPYNVKKLI